MRRQALQKADSSDDAKPGTGLDVDALRRLMEGAENGDKAAMGELRAILDKNGTWGLLGDLAAISEDAQIKVTTGDNLLLGERLKRHVAEMKRELRGPHCTPLERLLVDRIAVCWLQAQYADTVYTQNIGKVGLQLGEYHQRRQDRTHRRLVSAIKALATVRKLALPALQVNIGDKQVNIVGALPLNESGGRNGARAVAEENITSVALLPASAS